MPGLPYEDGAIRHERREPPDVAVARLAARQYGVVAARQLRRLGLTRDAIKRRVISGRLHRLHRGVYAVGHVVLTTRGHWMAAVLAAGPGALLSHREGAALLDLRESHRSRIDVTVVGRSRRRRPGIDVHVTTNLHPDDRTGVDGIPVASVARTLLDLADVVDAHAVQRAFERAERLRTLDLSALTAVLSRSNGRRGVAVIGSLIGYDPTAAAAAESELERLFLDLIRRAGLPMPSVGVLIEGFVVDAYWPSAQLVVELDGYEFHRNRAAFERDRAKTARLQRAGYEVLRLTYRQVIEEAESVVATARALLSRAPNPRRHAGL